MEQCPKCKARLINPQAEYCSECGCQIISESKSSEPESNDDLDFIITETAGQDPDFVRSESKFSDSKDDLDLQTTSDLVQDEGRIHSEEDPLCDTDNLQQNNFTPIGESDSPLPPVIDDNQSPPSFQNNIEVTSEPMPDSTPKAESNSTPEQPKDTDKADIYLSDREKEEILRKIGNGKAVNMSPPTPPEKSPPKAPVKPTESTSALSAPSISMRECGIAYFYRNYIQMAGSQQLHPNDEVLVNGRAYRLKPKKLRPSVLIGAATTMFIGALILIGSLMLSTGDTGNGEVIGIVLNESGEPFVDGAIIRFPEFGLAIKSNPEGFFRSGDIPCGSHKIEYKVDGKIIGEEFITVASDQVSTISLKPNLEASGSTNTTASNSTQNITIAQSAPAQDITTSKTEKQTNTKATKPKTSFSKITLAANIDGAKLSLDGSVVGAGNMTYSRIKAGKHKYVVEADGYAPVSGVVTLKAGETNKLDVVLEPMEAVQKEQVYTAEDFYYSGMTLVKEGNNQTAIEDLTKAIELDPSYAEAYLARADVYTKLKVAESAHDDYVRTAEIFRFRKDFNHAITAYNSAIKTDKKSITAYLGRGDLYLAKGQEIAAISDYDAAKKINKKNPAVHFGLGKARFQLDNHKKAIKHFKEARKLDENNPVVYQYLMLSYLAIDNFKEVKKNFSKFAKVATEAEIQRMTEDNQYSAVLHIVDEQ